MRFGWKTTGALRGSASRRGHLYDPFKNEVNNLEHLGRCPPGSSHNPCDGIIVKVTLREREGQKGKAIRVCMWSSKNVVKSIDHYGGTLKFFCQDFYGFDYFIYIYIIKYIFN